MPNYQGVWSLSTQFQNASGWPSPPVENAAVLLGGYFTGFVATDNIGYVSLITATSSESSFGTLSSSNYRSSGAFANGTRAFVAGGRNSGGLLNTIEFVTFAAGGSATDFGDRTVSGQNIGACNSDTRGVMGYADYGSGASAKTIDYVTMASAGNATDFGDFTANPSGSNNLACSSPTRGLWSYHSTSGSVTEIDYITIASAGNASSFGDLANTNSSSAAAFSSNTRGIIVSGGINVNSSNAATNTMEYVTIASTGNATDFGDLSYAGGWWPQGTSNKIKGVTMGGRDLSNSTEYANMDVVTIATTGNGTDFGDMAQIRYTGGCAGGRNGGLS